jgi:hypothetical protein
VSERKTARIKLLSILLTLPLDADVSMDVRGLTRKQYDSLQAEDEVRLDNSDLWVKDQGLGEGAIVSYWTSKPPSSEREPDETSSLSPEDSSAQGEDPPRELQHSAPSRSDSAGLQALEHLERKRRRLREAWGEYVEGHRLRRVK